MARRARMAIAAGAMLLAVAACGSDSKSGVTARRAEQSDSTPATDTTVVESSAVDTVATTENTAPVTTDVSTSEAPETTEPEITEPETTEPESTEPATTESSTPLFPSGWKPFAITQIGVIGPKAEENWTGVPSPPLPPAGQPLADGIYPADAVAWTSSDPSSLDITVRRLDLCTALPEDACINFGDPYQPTELGVDESTTLPLTVTLDDTVGVVMVGYECTSVVKRGNGADLAALYAAFDTAYTSTIAPQLAPDGSTDQAIIEAIGKAPTAGFSAAATNCPENFDSGLVFTSGGAPPILMQVLTGFIDTPDGGFERPLLTPISATGLETVEVVDGRMTLYIYAGFYS